MSAEPDKHRPTKTLKSHSDHSFPDPGLYREVYCGICGKSMPVQRDVMGPTSFVEAMSIQLGQGTGHRHDRFYCEDRDHKWHRQAEAIQKMARKSPSLHLATQLEQEAREIIQNRRATKTDW